ncbi:MAG: EF-hand domain-containing protein [Proteobacteria bacterium]|nr:EF-hand domain-containing protein [Pseudomonadota bacterium]
MPKMAWRCVGLASGLLMLSGAALAQDDSFMPGVIGAESGMSAIDFDAARMSFFNQADTNGDLALSSQEMAEAMAHGGSPLFEGADTDGNGSIGLDEYMESGNDLFSRLDADGDGTLTSGEM